MVEEHVSSGILPLTRDESPEYLLLQYPQGHWGFPKGHVESGENLLETVLRELEEETGLSEIDPFEDFQEEIEYWYHHDESRHHKIVHFFAGYVARNPVQLSDEHVDYDWLSTDETRDTITYDNERQLFENWLDFYHNH